MIESLKSRLRNAVVGWLDLPKEGPATPASVAHPLGVDRLAKLPIHYEPPECPLCIFEDGICHDCGGSLLDPLAPYGYGVESATITHIHIHTIPDAGGRQSRVPARRKLCLSCFRKDWAVEYPNKPCDL